MNKALLILAALWLLLAASPAPAQFRFPMPEFDSDYVRPETHAPQDENHLEPWDGAILFGALCLAAWLVLKRRSRREIFLLTALCLVYFGFFRKGCVCAVGSVQNVAAVFFDGGAAISVTVLLFFLLPLFFALFFGRVFCAAVCPLGAIQEAVAFRPVRIARPIEEVLRVIPVIYLGLTVLAVANNAGFLICRYDPFVGFFRMGAGFNMLIIGGLLLLTGVFIFRPYCRYLCPYGVLLGWLSRFSKWHATITPADCIQCRLCEDSCPYGAIDRPAPEIGQKERREGTRRLGLMLALAPVIIAVCAGTGWVLHDVLSLLHPTVRLAERVAAEDVGQYDEISLESETFRAGQQTKAQLYAEAGVIKEDFKYGGACLGAFVGLVIGGRLVSLSLARRRKDYEPDRGACVSCGRCFAYCPVKKEG